TRTSHIYQQAGARSVCIITYTHLAVFVRYTKASSTTKSMELVHEVFKTVESMNPSKDAHIYWQAVNRKILDFDGKIAAIWKEEKQASVESIQISRDEALGFLASERERIMRFTKEQAIKEVLKASNLDNKIWAIHSVVDNDLIGLG
ncbi:restriction endonuclease, partial [Achromatium sp. WMS3]